MSVLMGKQIVLGITGCIAAYKAAELVRLIVKHGGQVHVIMTRSAREFVSPLTFQTLSGNPVATDLFALYEERKIGHISLAQRADVLVVAPATANSIGKTAGGIADDLLSTAIMATRAPLLFAPAMNEAMWENPVVQKNMQALKSLGYYVVDPGWGDLACGAQGKGRLADVEDILDEIITILSPKDFARQEVLVTAGPTHEPMDSVRFITNPSSGKMGFALARALKQRGASVTLVTGPSALFSPRNVHVVKVKTAQEMASAVDKYFSKADIIIKSAAVSDYRPTVISAHKIKKQDAAQQIEFERTSDILAALGKKKGNKILVGFAAETHEILANAREKLQKKNLDMIVANDVGKKDSGFGSDVNKVTLLLPGGEVVALPSMSKDDVAQKILDRIVLLRKERAAIPDEPA
ncbi:MAG: bifunctional phosphopantothenoylcysteine decarboxylase/phosphopantothenate--cysteine ligase CoaBC [Pseudomonadota bacterium]